MTLLELKKAIYGYVGRDVGDPSTSTLAGDLVQNDVDLCLLAINQARLRAQREYDFKSFETILVAQTNRYGVSFDTGFFTDPTQVTPTVVKSVTGVYEFTEDGSTVRLGKPIDYTGGGDISRLSGVVTSRKYAFVRGRALFYENQDELTWVAVTAHPLLPDLADGDSPDFFLNFGHDWLLLASIRQLNLLLKEDARVAVPQRQLDEAWQSLTRFDLDQSGWTSME